MGQLDSMKGEILLVSMLEASQGVPPDLIDPVKRRPRC